MDITKITSYLTNEVQNSNGGAAKSGAQEKAAENNIASDRVQLSKDYQDLASTQKSIAGSNDIRAEKVQQIKSQLENGSYQVQPGEVAKKMLDEVI
jgi:negative regulator of flagellin synthesis FlgM